MIRIRKKKQFVIRTVTCLALFLLIWANWYSLKIMYMVLAGEVHKIIHPESYKEMQKASRLQWFDEMAQDTLNSLQAASGWGYLSEDQFNSMPNYSKQYK